MVNILKALLRQNIPAIIRLLEEVVGEDDELVGVLHQGPDYSHRPMLPECIKYSSDLCKNFLMRAMSG